MDNKKYMGILRLFKKKSFKLSLVCLSLIGMLASSGASFAKYRDENYGGGNAGTAKFGSWSVDNNMQPINVPSNATYGWYAFKASFSITFTEGEVRRAYTLKVKDVNISDSSNNFNDLNVSSKLSFHLPANPGTIRTITRSESNSNGEVTSTVVDRNVENTLMQRSDISFTSNYIYLMYEETHGDSITGSPWKVYPVDDSIYDSSTKSIILTNDHVIESNEADTHVYYLIYFVYIDAKDIGDIKFIYSLDVRQVI